ncbi:MAG: FISUMP domain-containing protein, partial [Bacteroidota bacterium]|nr:FISUMP domain-containing protein [Bacteroidota bacterium]
FNMMDTSITLQANSAIVGTGQWSIISGTSGIIQNTGNPVSQFSGFAGNQYFLIWTIGNYCWQNADTIEITFAPDSTSFYCGYSMASDIDGNYYTTTQIGSQCWMAENMKAIQYSDGFYVTNGNWVGNLPGYNYAKYYFDYNSNSANSEIYGRLYTWLAASNSAINLNDTIQGICPTGWHLPSDTEWETLAVYIANDNGGTSNGYVVGGSGGDDWELVGDHLKSTTGWNTGNGTDDYGFSALPAGFRYYLGYNYYYYYLDLGTFWWSATESSSNEYFDRYIGIDHSFLRQVDHNSTGKSVRCVKD